MPVNTRELLEAVAMLMDERNMRVAIQESGRGALICGVSCFVGGLLLGPAGLAIGGTVGGLTAAAVSRGRFRSVADIIRNDLTEFQSQDLYDRVVNALRHFSPEDLALLIPLLMGNAGVQQACLRTVSSFVSSQLQMQIVD